MATELPHSTTFFAGLRREPDEVTMLEVTPLCILPAVWHPLLLLGYRLQFPVSSTLFLLSHSHDAVAQVAVLGAAPGAPPLLAALKRYQQYNPPATFKMDTNVLPQVNPYHSPLSLFTHRGNSAQVCVRCALCAVRCALCTVRCALCAVRCALCAVRCALCTVRCALCAVRCAHVPCAHVPCALCAVRCAHVPCAHVPCAMCHVPCAMCACAMCHVPCAMCHVRMCHVPCAMCHVPCAMCHVPCAMCHVPYAMCHVPCAMCHVTCDM